jgi:HAMP domain-containing protein
MEVDPDATRVITFSEAEMARHLAEQMSAQITAQTAAQQAQAAQAHAATVQAVDIGEGQTAVPISAERAAQLARAAAATAATAAAAGTAAFPRQAPQAPMHRSAAQASPPDIGLDQTRFVPTQVTLQAADGLAQSSASWSASAQSGFGELRDGYTLPHGGLGGAGNDASVRQVGRYQVTSRLGRGGMASVYRAHDPSIHRDVAIKFLHPSLSEDPDCRMRFLREARAAGGLSHPNIVVVHDVGEIENRPYMAMELIDGAPLSDKLDAVKRLPIRDVVVIGLQLARALEYAHGRGIVHRDIKPGNIMLLGDGRSIKVADFGIAHMDDGSGEQRTMVGAVMGTPQYMSPEQTRGDKVDGRSDLFSAGIVLYQMLAGERPFRGDSMVAVVTKIATEEAAPLNQKRTDVPPALRRVVDRCLAKSPAQRYQTGREMAEALQKVLYDIDEAARESNKPRIVPLRVKWALTMGLVVAVVMGLTSAVITQRQYAAMMGQAADSGSSLARFIAAQNAAAVLGDDWDAVDVLVQEMMTTRNFERISVVDMNGQVRVSSVPALVGQAYKPEGIETATVDRAGTAVKRYSSAGEDVLGFEAPVLFQGKRLGKVVLGVPEKPLTEVARLSISLMIVLVLVTVLAVATAMYFVANWFAKPIRLVGESMAEIGKGRFDHRINEQRNDEFGLLFTAFDNMAKDLQGRTPNVPAAPPTYPPLTVATDLPTTSVQAAAASSGGGERS